jgi:Cu-processing system permease protein
MMKVIKYVMIDILRSRVILAYTIFLLIASLSIFNLEDNPAKGLLSLLNIILIIVPLVSLIFSTIYLYNSSEFIELLLSQPIRRKQLLISLYGGVSCSLSLAFIIGAAIPVLLLEGSSVAWMMVFAGLALTFIFSSLAFVGSVITRDKTRGIGIAIMIWLCCSLLYDGLMLLIVFQFSDYPLEKPMVALCSLNPVDLARVLVLLKMDISALMGYTGAVFGEFFGSTGGMVYSSLIMLGWILLPLFVALRKFHRKDL